MSMNKMCFNVDMRYDVAIHWSTWHCVEFDAWYGYWERFLHFTFHHLSITYSKITHNSISKSQSCSRFLCILRCFTVKAEKTWFWEKLFFNLEDITCTMILVIRGDENYMFGLLSEQIWATQPAQAKKAPCLKLRRVFRPIFWLWKRFRQH